MDPAATIRAYYESLRRGEPLSPYFVVDPRAVKFGITERLTGYEAIDEGLRSQTETTTDWRIESHELVVGERATHAWFADDVSMAWTDVTTGERHDYETRWSGTLRRHEDDQRDNDRRDDDRQGTDEDERLDAPEWPEWRFASMHVSRSGTR